MLGFKSVSSKKKGIINLEFEIEFHKMTDSLTRYADKLDDLITALQEVQYILYWSGVAQSKGYELGTRLLVSDKLEVKTFEPVNRYLCRLRLSGKF